MHKQTNSLTTGLILCVGILTALVLAAAPLALALPTADDFGVENTSGYKDTYTVVPVIITNAQNGPIISLIFDIAYDKNAINIVDVRAGTLTSSWDSPVFNNFAWGTRFLIVYNGNTSQGIQNGTTGSVALLTFSLVGTPGSTSQMNLSNIQLSDTGYVVGTAPAKNGTLSILGEPEPTSTPTPAPTPPPAGGGGGGGGGGGAPWDSDKDGLSDIEELLRGTDPKNPDTDGDGIIDSLDPFPLNPMLPEKPAFTPTPSPSPSPSPAYIPPSATPTPLQTPPPPFPMVPMVIVIATLVGMIIAAITYWILRRRA